MEWFREDLTTEGYESTVYAEHRPTGLRTIISVHNTGLGPACGGIRMLPYVSKEEALNDVLRLAKGMSYKSALAGIGFGGGKSVIIGDPEKKSEKLFHAFGEFVESFKGKYIAAKDMNINSADLLQVKSKTKHVLGIEGEKGSSGDPSPVTARGILKALEATAEQLKGSRSLQGLKIAIQGVGHVGFGVAELARRQGAEIFVTDANPEAVRKAEKELGATAVAPQDILSFECDILSPCARGAILNAKTIKSLRCRAIVGAANNQLETENDGMRLHERGILYAPDYVINSGGIINIFVEFEGYDQNKAFQKADGIYDVLKELYRRARERKTAPFAVADELAEERLYGSR